ncbi:MAG: hypothetical protein FJ293_16400, partial [Planctomycetes bacterium]|nr:hypothetical protein [Planctomycetota bacterium]
MEGRETDRPRSGALARFLATELRLPLSTLARLGARLAGRTGEQKAVGRALARECERLDVLVTNALEFGMIAEPVGGGGEVVLAEALEKAISGQRAWIEAHQIRLRVVDSSREAAISGERDVLLPCLFALFSDLLERLPDAATIVVRLRDVAGLVRVDIESPAPADAAAFARPARVRLCDLA